MSKLGIFAAAILITRFSNNLLNPRTSKPWRRVLENHFSRTGKKLGKEFLKQIHASMKTTDDPLLKYYSETQIKRLVQYSDFRDEILDIVVVDSPSLNAFAAPGGVVGVNLGLFLQANDVHEFSSVIAHELAHLSQRHFARRVEERRSGSLTTMASMIAGLLIGAAGGTDAALATISLAQAASQGNQLRYSREREIEADRIGLATMVNAGLDPTEPHVCSSECRELIASLEDHLNFS